MIWSILAAVWFATTSISVNAIINDFQIGIQLCDGNAGASTGSILYTPWFLDGDTETNGWSYWAGDMNYYDPDGMRIGLFGRYNTAPGTPTEFKIEDTDIRFCIQLTDTANSQYGNPAQEGIEQCTGWASSGGGWSMYACDKGCYDFDAVRIKLETKYLPGLVITDIRTGIQLTDGGTNPRYQGSEKYTNWLVGAATQTSTWSNWAGDRNFYDPDSIKIFLGVHKSLGNPAKIQDEVDDVGQGRTKNGYNSGIQFDRKWIIISIFSIFLVALISAVAITCYFSKRSKKYVQTIVQEHESEGSDCEMVGTTE